MLISESASVPEIPWIHVQDVWRVGIHVLPPGLGDKSDTTRLFRLAPATYAYKDGLGIYRVQLRFCTNATAC